MNYCVHFVAEDGDRLIVPQNIYRRALNRRDPKKIRKPQVIDVDGDSLVFTENEWKKLKMRKDKRDFVDQRQL
jgi:hypothetical protein